MQSNILGSVNLILKAWHVAVSLCPDVVGVSFFWQCDWLRHRFLAVVLATLRECVRRSISCTEALVEQKGDKNFQKSRILGI